MGYRKNCFLTILLLFLTASGLCVDAQGNISEGTQAIQTNSWNNSSETSGNTDKDSNSPSIDDEEEMELGVNLLPLLIFLGLIGYYSYSRGIRRLFTYKGEGLTLRAIIRNTYLLFMSLLFALISLTGAKGNWVVFSFIMLWMIPFTLYWTPPVQIRLYDRFRNNLLLYIAQIFTGVFGTIFVLYKLYKNQKQRSKIIHNVLEEKDAMISSINEIEAPPRLEPAKDELVQQVKKLGDESSFHETKKEYRNIEDQVKVLKGKSKKYKGRLQELEKDLERWRKEAESLEVAGYLESDSEIFELIEELQDTKEVEDFKDGLEEVKESVKDKKKEIIETYVEKFAENHGRGNSEQIKKLKKSIEKREELELSEVLLKNAIEETVEQKEKNALEELLELHNPEEYEDYVEAFVLEFGKGNEVQKAYLAEILGYWKDKIETDVERTFKEKREEKELEQFEEDLGLADEEPSTSDSKINELESQKRKLLENIEKDKVSLGDLEELNGLEFEEFLADLFEKMGYRTKVTKGSNDQGADLIAKKPHETVVIQAKHYQNNVSNSAVQEVNTALDYYDGDRGLVVGTSGFTSSAKKLARKSDVELWDKNKLHTKMEKYLNESKI